MDRLATYVAAWKTCAADLEDLLRSLDDDDWSRATDCPGWTVRDIVAHSAALEAELAGDPGPRVELPDDAVANLTGAYTQAGIDERKDRTHEELVDEFTDAVLRRAAELDADPPDDPQGTPTRRPHVTTWDWQTLLQNRVIDLWVHEQDIRRAVDRPGGMDSPGAEVTVGTFMGALPFVIGKRAGAEPGNSVVVVVDGRENAYAVTPEGRCQPSDGIPETPTVRLTMDAETLALLGAGRRDPLTLEVGVAGDRELGERILQSMAVTP